MKVNVKAAALAGALIFGFGLFLLTWWIIIVEGASTAPTFIGRVYVGYTVSPLGSLIGLAYAAIDGAVCVGIFAWLYNKFA